MAQYLCHALYFALQTQLKNMVAALYSSKIGKVISAWGSEVWLGNNWGNFWTESSKGKSRSSPSSSRARGVLGLKANRCSLRQTCAALPPGPAESVWGRFLWPMRITSLQSSPFGKHPYDFMNKPCQTLTPIGLGCPWTLHLSPSGYKHCPGVNQISERFTW